MASKVKEKLQLLPKDEIKCRELIENLKKTLNIWFLYGADNDNILREVLNSCVEIILHGLRNVPEKLQTNINVNAFDYESSPNENNIVNNNNKDNDLNLVVINKIIDDFKWVRNAVSSTRNLNSTPSCNVLSNKTEALCTESLRKQSTAMRYDTPQTTLALHVKQWLINNLSEDNLCAFVQYLVTDKELLEDHYYQEALLRQDKYVTILVIGLTAFETHNYCLLNQIESVSKVNLKKAKHHKRSYSHPNVIVPKTNLTSVYSVDKFSTSATPPFLHNTSSVILAIRKAKSLPEFTIASFKAKNETDSRLLKRVEYKTINSIKTRSTKAQNIKQNENYYMNWSNSHPSSPLSGSIMYENNDNQPTTSQASYGRSKSSLSNYTLNFSKSIAPSLTSNSVSSSSSNSTTKCINLINTDDIKIWTDYSWEIQQKNKEQHQLPVTTSCAVPTPVACTTKPSKSLSPLNSFFLSLFSTPPSYTSWFIDHDIQTEHDTTETAIESIISENNSHESHHSVMSPQQQVSSSSLSCTVFEKFLPIDGKKLRSRKTQNLFEDVNVTINCSDLNMLTSPANNYFDSPSTASSPGHAVLSTPKQCQSLTRFLQMSHLSRNNTELEKENAHFRISEAIISAIEHMKWNNFETKKSKQCRETTALATDCLSPSDRTQNSNIDNTSCYIEGEHIPYVELEEVSYDFLSAEVVGLSLISKFEEEHLPKVSELKWLVSDEDTPQKLLPMPDLTSSANPDDHIIHSATRGTRYWAPPRQQIIFTDNPSPNRKELLKKQNYRCAGCGMRVSLQYMHSFRYCTYLGKYHCTGCHRNQISATPAKILQAWDFKCYPVSVFAYRLLEQMYAYPLFYVPDLNPALYIRSKSLLSARKKRLQLKFVKDFIRMCRFALREQSYFESVPDYITADIDNWSLSDFIDARAKCLHRSIDELINMCEIHIFNCVLCTARGFLCEYCHADMIVYPWGQSVKRCDRCGTCFHRNCWKSMSGRCCRCQRIDKRQYEINNVV